MSGGVKTVFMENCSMEHGAALYLKCNLERGGYIEDVWVRNLKIGRARILRLRNNYHGYRGGSFPTRFRNIHIEDVHIKQGSNERISAFLFLPITIMGRSVLKANFWPVHCFEHRPLNPFLARYFFVNCNI